MGHLPALGLTGAFVLAATFAAPAATVTFDFTSSTTTPTLSETGLTLSFTEAGLDLDVSANAYYNPKGIGFAIRTYSDVDVTREDGEGLSVHQNQYDNVRIDGHMNEVVTFDFGTADVSITQVTFGSIQPNSLFDLFVSNSANLILVSSDNTVSATTSVSAGPSSLFGIGATDDMTGFKIESLTVEFTPTPANEPLPAPLPAGGVLLLSGLGALALRRRLARKS